MIDQESLFNLAAFFGDFGFNAVHVIAHVHAIGDGSFVVVFGHAVLLKIGDGLRGRRCCQSSEEAVEVFEHLPPQVVNGSMTFIGDDEVEHLDRHFAVVDNVTTSSDTQSRGQLRAGDIVGAVR